ncbi:MAG: hypothetical protein QM676_05195 [Novosphingobium sp.]
MQDPHDPAALPAPSPEPQTDLPERWCKARMADFLRTLAASQSVSEAARSVGMSRQSAYRLRARLKGEPFDIAWEAAFQHGYDELAQAALERAMHGVEMPVFQGGEQVGSYRKYDERLTCFLLAQRNAQGAQRLGRYTAASEYWSERWDRMLDLVEHGPALWPQENGEPHTPESRASQDNQAVRALDRRHAPDERGGVGNASPGRRHPSY